MFRLSNSLLGLLNFLTFFLSIPILVGGIWLHIHGSTDCERFFDKPVIVLGFFLMLVSLAGLIGACRRVTWLLWIYLFVMFILIALLFAFTIFAFVVTNTKTATISRVTNREAESRTPDQVSPCFEFFVPDSVGGDLPRRRSLRGKGGGGHVTSGRGYTEYKLGDYSNWLQKRVENDKNWSKIRSCLQDAKVCQSLQQSNVPFEQFVKENLSPFQSGCCSPPSECGYIYRNATIWDPPPSATPTNPDCTTWSNVQTDLCYNCQSCKAGVLANLNKSWRKVAVVNIVFLIFLIIVYNVGCCAFRNNRNDNNYDGVGKGRP